jgi:hypothetical protein
VTKQRIKTRLKGLRRRAAKLQSTIGDKRIRKHFVTQFVTRMNILQKHTLPNALVGVHATMWMDSLEFSLEQIDALLGHTEKLVRQHPKDMKVRTRAVALRTGSEIH